MGDKLEGFLYKQGEAVIGPLGKSFQKRWFCQRGNNLFYYKNKNDVQEQGYINLAEAILCQETQNKDRREFQINTARRIWVLQAENEDGKKYWVNGISQFINSLREGTTTAGPRASVRFETMENRLRDLETQERVLRRALSLAAGRLSVSVESLIAEAEREVDSTTDSLSNEQKSMEIAPALPSATMDVKPVDEKPVESMVNAVPVAVVADQMISATPETNPPTENTSTDANPTPAVAPVAPTTATNETSHESQMAATIASDEMKFEDSKVDSTPTPTPTTDASNTTTTAAASTSAGSMAENNQAKQEEPKATAAVASSPTTSSTVKEPMKRFKARVLYDYNAQQDYEMTVRVDEVITVLSKHGNGWWLGSSADGKQGYFPGSYVEQIDG